MKKLVLQGFIEVPENDLDTILSELPRHIAATHREAGCLVFRVEQDRNNPLRFNVYEEFESRIAFDAHQQRVKASRWGSVAKDARRQYEIAEI